MNSLPQRTAATCPFGSSTLLRRLWCGLRGHRVWLFNADGTSALKGRDAEGMVMANCADCGKPLKAISGLSLPGFRFGTNPRQANVSHHIREEHNMKKTTERIRVVAASDLLALAESMGDKEESICAAELLLLRKIAATSSDLVKARHWEEFRQINGGIEGFEAAHCGAVGAWEQWHRDGEG